jgi:hypothetical protein
MAIKETTTEARDTAVMEKKITGAAKNSRQENQESTTYHQRICSMDHATFILRSLMENECPDTQ